jgi:hypothetical protein
MKERKGWRGYEECRKQQEGGGYGQRSRGGIKLLKGEGKGE